MHKPFESIERAMRRDQTRAPEPMRSTLPNTDQPRIPHSEYHCTVAAYCSMFKRANEGKLKLLQMYQAKQKKENMLIALNRPSIQVV